MAAGLREVTLRKWHRNTGIVLALLIAVQAFSGGVIAFQGLLSAHHEVSAFLDAREVHTLHRFWDYVGIYIHYGGSTVGAIYHAAVVLGLLWLVISGVMMYVRAQKRSLQRRRATKSGT